MISPNVVTKQLGFPLHGVTLSGRDRAIAGGGGGDGKHGIPNQIVALKPYSVGSSTAGQSGQLEIDFTLDLPRRVIEGKADDEGEEATRVSAPDPEAAAEVYRSVVAVTLPTRCVVYGKKVEPQDFAQLPVLLQKLAADATKLRASGKIAPAQELDKLCSALAPVQTASRDENPREEAMAVKSASRVAAAVVQALCTAGECHQVSTAYEVQGWLTGQRRKRRKSAANLAALAGEAAAPLIRLGEFEIEIKDCMTELKFSIFNRVGDLLVMGTNQGMLLTFRFFPDGGMQVLEHSSHLDLKVELLEAGFSDDSRFIAFISTRKCWFIDMAAANAQPPGAQPNLQSIECQLEKASFRRCQWVAAAEGRPDQLYVSVVEFLPGTTKVASHICVFEFNGQGAPKQITQAAIFPRGPMTAFCVSHDGKRLAAGDDEGRIHLFKLPEFTPICVMTVHAPIAISRIIFNKADTIVISSSLDTTVAYSDVREEVLLKLVPKTGMTTWITYSVLMVFLGLLVQYLLDQYLIPLSP